MHVVRGIFGRAAGFGRVKLRMNLDVVLKRILTAEALIAVVADVSQRGAVVDVIVRHQRAAIRVALRARAALERMLRRVIRQVVLAREGLAAHAARVRLVPGVKARVALEVRTRRKRLEAAETGKQTVQRLVVVAQRLGTVEAAAANSAFWNGRQRFRSAPLLAADAEEPRLIIICNLQLVNLMRF